MAMTIASMVAMATRGTRDGRNTNVSSGLSFVPLARYNFFFSEMPEWFCWDTRYLAVIAKTKKKVCVRVWRGAGVGQGSRRSLVA